jgi:UDP-glucose 4-epimerase
MKVLVTGGAGFIGSNIVRRLLDLEHHAVVLDDLSSGYRQNLLAEVPFVEGDVRDAGTVRRAAQGCDVILHLAASVGNKRSIEHPLTDSAINLLGTLNVLEAARSHGIHRVVFSSSAGVFGELKTLPISEDHAQDPDSPYGTSKLAAEKMCLVYNKLHGMSNLCLRYFNVYGPHQRFDAYGNVIPIFANRLLTRQPLVIFGDGEQTRDFVNAHDVAAANLRAALAPSAVKGAFNIGSGTRISIRTLASRMQEVAGIAVGVSHAPPRPGDVRDSLADIRLARAAFGYEPEVPLEQGLAVYWQWMIHDPVTLQQTGARP